MADKSSKSPAQKRRDAQKKGSNVKGSSDTPAQKKIQKHKKTIDKMITGGRSSHKNSCEKRDRDERRKALAAKLYRGAYPVGLPKDFDTLNRRSVKLHQDRSRASSFQPLATGFRLAKWASGAKPSSPLTEFMAAHHAPVNVISRAACSFITAINPIRRNGHRGFETTPTRLKTLHEALQRELSFAPADTEIPEVLVAHQFVCALINVISRTPWWPLSTPLLLDEQPFPPEGRKDAPKFLATLKDPGCPDGVTDCDDDATGGADGDEDA